MIRVHIICEGQTEETFINEVLADIFHSKGIYLIPSLIGKPGHKGGNLKFDRLFTDIQARLKGDSTAYCTTFFDFYGLPEDFPGKTEALSHTTIAKKAQTVTEALAALLEKRIEGDLLRRFIPYVQMYEFEGLLFSAPDKLARGIGQDSLATKFQAIRQQFNSPEEINNSPHTAPSKRITALYAGYDKPVYGSLAAIEIGIDNIRNECPLFNKWVNSIEALDVIM